MTPAYPRVSLPAAPAGSPARPEVGLSRWGSGASLTVVQSALSPALLVQCGERRLSLFAGLQERGLGAPGHAAFGADGGPRIVTNGHPADVSRMNERWVLVWFAGAAGWTNWDAPWAVFLSHRPSVMVLDAAGLHFEFPNQAGEVTLLPLYGYFKPPAGTNGFQQRHGLPDRKVQTWQWAEVIPREPLMRVRYWAAALKRFPLDYEEFFSVDAGRGTVAWRQRFQWHAVADEWSTRSFAMAPLSPVLALAMKDGRLPVRLDGAWFDFEMPTPFGPLAGVQDREECEWEVPFLGYVLATEAPVSRPITNAAAAAALERLRGLTRAVFIDEKVPLMSGPAAAPVREMAQAVSWLARALPYLEPSVRSNAVAGLRRIVRERLIPAEALQRYSTPGGVPAFEAGGEYLAVAGALWTYVHHAGDWDFVREIWPALKTPASTWTRADWIGMDRDGFFGLTDGLSGLIALARMAYRLGDAGAYLDCVQDAAREAVRLAARLRGGNYFREMQPWHTMELLREPRLGGLERGLAGWHLDERPGSDAADATARWGSLADFDVARFCRDQARAELARELGGIKGPATRGGPERIRLLRMRSLLLNQSCGELAPFLEGTFNGAAAWEEIAACLALLRTSAATQWERLIAGNAASGWRPEPGRPAEPGRTELLWAIAVPAADRERTGDSPEGWPEIVWPDSWKTPTGRRWSFGRVIPGGPAGPAPTRVERVAVSPVAQAQVFRP